MLDLPRAGDRRQRQLKQQLEQLVGLEQQQEEEGA